MLGCHEVGGTRSTTSPRPAGRATPANPTTKSPDGCAATSLTRVPFLVAIAVIFAVAQRSTMARPQASHRGRQRRHLRNLRDGLHHRHLGRRSQLTRTARNRRTCRRRRGPRRWTAHSERPDEAIRALIDITLGDGHDGNRITAVPLRRHRPDAPSTLRSSDHLLPDPDWGLKGRHCSTRRPHILAHIHCPSTMRHSAAQVEHPIIAAASRLFVRVLAVPRGTRSGCAVVASKHDAAGRTETWPEPSSRGVTQAQPSCRSECPSFQIFVMCRIRSPSNSIA